MHSESKRFGAARLTFSVAILLFSWLPFLQAQESQAIPAHTLNQILQLAEQRNPSLAVFRANLSAAEGVLRSSRAYPNPVLEFDYGGGKPTEEADSSYKREYGFGVEQVLEWPGKRSNRIKSAESELGAAQQDVEDFRYELRVQVKQSFYAVLLAERILEASKKNIEIAQALLSSAKLRVDSGEAPELERIKAQVELLKVTKELRQSENRTVASKAVLNSLLGGALGRVYEVTGEFSDSQGQYDLTSLIEFAEKNHPAILREMKKLEAASFGLKSEQQSRYPDLAFSASTGQEIDKRSYGFGLALEIPLWYQKQGEIAVATAGVARAQSELEQTKAELEGSITEEFQNYQIALGQLEVFDQGLLSQAEEALRVVQFSYQQGESDLLEYLDAERTYRATLVEYHQAQFELQTALARLERVSGGLP